jgi:hypothetical protein
LRKVGLADNLLLLILNLNNNSGRWRPNPLDSWSELMKIAWHFVATLASLFVLLPITSARAVSPYTENFPATTANWISPSEPATFVSSGGPDGSSYITVQRNPTQISFGTSVTMLNGTDALNASSDQFVGDWLAAGITHFSAYVRHDASEALPILTRFATSANFPGTTSSETVVQPNTWTQLNYDILPSSIGTTLNPEGPPSVFTQTFAGLGNIQFFFTVPTGLTGSTTNITFGFDQISTSVPEPASVLIVATALFGAFGIRRRGVA